MLGFAAAFSFLLDSMAREAATGVEKLHESLHFRVIIFFAAAGKTRSQAHFHFGIHAAGKRGIAANFDLAAADFEKIESAGGESFGGAARGKGAVVGAGRRQAGFVERNAASDVATRIGVAEAHLQNGGRPDAQHVLVALGEKFLRVEVAGEDLLEARAGKAVAHAACHLAEIETLAGGIGWTEQTLETALQILRADQQRLGARVAKFDEANSWTLRKSGEEVLVLIDFKGGTAV